MTEKKDGLEATLVQKSARYREAKRRIRMQDLLAALPRETALVDLLEFNFFRSNTEERGKLRPQRHFVAFVVQPGQTVEPIDLGPADAISQAVIDWRKTFGASIESVQAGAFLRKQVWERLEPRLQGVRRVLISPDKALGRLPFYALPGKKRNTFLIEDYSIASIPVPQLLPALMQRRNSEKRPRGDLLLIGDVDYTADPQGSESSQGEQRPRQLMADLSFRPLPATADEIANIADLYHSAHADSKKICADPA